MDGLLDDRWKEVREIGRLLGEAKARKGCLKFKPAANFLSVCTGWIGKGRKKMGIHKASRKIKRRAAGGDRF